MSANRQRRYIANVVKAIGDAAEGCIIEGPELIGDMSHHLVVMTERDLVLPKGVATSRRVNKTTHEVFIKPYVPFEEWVIAYPVRLGWMLVYLYVAYYVVFIGWYYWSMLP